ncbi:type II toxin-antitoxin system VapC family toxin [Mycolicibacterium sp.]|uniref:type II toxin-antitoxin system VapC family toxin n=1 Tax=Mycolicibacterium sp. TaxID=2320850 RepID=UPI001D2EE083|nr:type II toxin-antitoxin system VapC family toxin [Mycolicibacterium sp.]MCB1292149.1 type II toxin-antitoxin system VapC family toxin [Mycobacterium sp.]MCB9409518.1 type II toxin-antitoxin system VapC family toxin [Mycolicibacterium sp.]
MRTYFDTSALIKLVVAEPETSSLRLYLREIGGDTLFTAALTRTELIRAVRRVDVHALAAARRVLAGLATVNLTPAILDEAATLDPPLLRSLDAIHLAAAQRAGADLRAVVTYDARMSEAATLLGIPIAAPV